MPLKKECSICTEVTNLKYCTSCADTFCEACSNFLHKGAKNAHLMITDIKGATFLPSRTIKCWRHKDQHIKRYCVDCNVVACHCCAILHHPEHNLQHIDTVVLNHQNDLSIIRSYVLSQISDIFELKTNWENTFVEYSKLLEQNFMERRENAKKIIDTNIEELKSVYNDIITVKIDKNVILKILF
jgi:hypothetical protein